MRIETPSPQKGLLSWLEWGVRELDFLDEREARKECEVLLGDLLRLSRNEIYLSSSVSDPGIFPQFEAWVEARKERRLPLAYLLKKTYFWEHELAMEEGVFIPRPETEVLIESFLQEGDFSSAAPFYFLDLATGSGNIAVTMAGLFRHSKGVASDLSPKALSLSERNALGLGVKERLSFLQADACEAFQPNTFDVIFSNPPYVTQEEWKGLEPELHWEPERALVGGEDGLDFYRRMAQRLDILKPGGSLWVEMGEGQSLVLHLLFERSFREVKTFKDGNQIKRVFAGIGKWN